MVYGFAPFGYEGSLFQVEVDLRRGIPAVDLVGLADGAVREARERTRAAIVNSGFEFPPERVLIALSPCDLRKDGAQSDLAIAAGILKAKEGWEFGDILFMGELTLSGEVRPVRGVEQALHTARENGVNMAIVCSDLQHTMVPSGMAVIYIHHLKDIRACINAVMNGDCDFTSYPAEWGGEPVFHCGTKELDDIKDMGKYKLAVATAIAGRHNIIFVGAPGCGKTMLLQASQCLLPELMNDEIQQVRRVYSLAGMPMEIAGRSRPFRMPHQSASIEGMCGGGIGCRPGEITLANRGVLFLDDAAEFKSSVLTMLRVPLEGGQITLCRAGRSTVYPANFQLWLASQPCPCGNFLSKDKVCLCSGHAIEMYWRKYSGPLLDKIAVRMYVGEKDAGQDYSAMELRGMIKKAWKAQISRGKWNNQLVPEEVMFNEQAAEILRKWLEEHPDLSYRRVANIKRVARTVQDMKEPESVVVDESSVSMALSVSDIEGTDLIAQF